jgi:hypothetical protein
MNNFQIALSVFAGIALFSALSSPSFFFKDDSDGKKRSGLVVFTDYKTGVQYLSTPMGGLTVRVDENGKPILIEKTKE